MKLVVTTRSSLRHRLFLTLVVHRLGEHLHGVVIQPDDARAATVPRPSRPLRSRIPAQARRAYRRLRPRPVGERDLLEALGATEPEGTGSGDRELAQMLDPLQPMDLEALAGRCDVLVGDPNGEEVQAWLQATAPDLVLVFGGKILRGAWLETPRLGALNMHYGVLPHYRGSHSTEFALYHERFDRVGASVHYIDEHIDAGDLVSVATVDLSRATSLEDGLALVYRAGFLGLLEAAAASLSSGERLVTKREEGPSGLYRARARSPFVEEIARYRVTLAARPFPRQQRAVEEAGTRTRLPHPSRIGRLRRRVRKPPPRHLPGVYILLYHAIVGGSPAPWETAYAKVATSVASFQRHLEYLSRWMTPLALEDCFEVLRTGAADKPYFVITFDDGYADLLENALPVCQPLGIRPTVFVNGDFAAQRSVYHRALLSLLHARGHGEELAARFAAELGPGNFTAGNVLDVAKERYAYGLTERLTRDAWARLAPGEDAPRVHLTFEELRELREAGWTIGNHTLTHPTLSVLSEPEIEQEIEENRALLQGEGLEPVPWLAYPNGGARHVGPAVERVLAGHPELMGVHANGGVNLFPSRLEWQRIPIGDDSVERLERMIAVNAHSTARAVGEVNRRL